MNFTILLDSVMIIYMPDVERRFDSRLGIALYPVEAAPIRPAETISDAVALLSNAILCEWRAHDLAYGIEHQFHTQNPDASFIAMALKATKIGLQYTQPKLSEAERNRRSTVDESAVQTHINHLRLAGRIFRSQATPILPPFDR